MKTHRAIRLFIYPNPKFVWTQTGLKLRLGSNMKQASVSGEINGAVEGCEVGERRSLGVDGGHEGRRRGERGVFL